MAESNAGTAGDIGNIIWDILDYGDQHYIKMGFANGTDFEWELKQAFEHHGKWRKKDTDRLKPGESTIFYMNTYGAGSDLEATVEWKKPGEDDWFLRLYAHVPLVGANTYELNIAPRWMDKYMLIEDGWFERNQRGSWANKCDMYTRVIPRRDGLPDYWKMWEHNDKNPY